MMSASKLKAATKAVLCAIVWCGCSASDPGPEMNPVVPVHGSVLFKGEPAPGAIVMFHKLPLSSGRFDTIRSRGVVQADGTFQVTTYNTDDGAPEGEYAVTIYWPGKRKGKPVTDEDSSDLPPDQLGLRFNAPSKSRLKAQVKGTETRLEPFELP